MKEQNRPAQLPGTPPPPPPQFKPDLASSHPKKSRRPLVIALCAVAAVLVIGGIGLGIHSAIRFVADLHKISEKQSESITLSGKDEIQDLFENDETQQNPSNPDLNLEPDPAILQYCGKWVGDSAEYAGITLDVNDIFESFIIILYEDGTCELWIDDEMTKGSWSLTSDGFEIADEFYFAVSGQEASLYYDEITITFVKQNS